MKIQHLSTGYEFPWDTVRALEIALYRTYCVPSISALLDRTGEFRHRFTDIPNRSYPKGYESSKLGPPRMRESKAAINSP